MGDFNLPHICWQTMNITGGSAEERRQAELLSVLQDRCITQFITEPTRANNILDLLLSNSTGIIHSYELLGTVMSDHKLIKGRFSANSRTVKNNYAKIIETSSTHLSLSSAT